MKVDNKKSSHNTKNTVHGDSDRIFEDKLQKRRTEHFTKKIRETGSTDQRHERNQEYISLCKKLYNKKQ